MTMGQDRIARENDIVELWEQLGDVLSHVDSLAYMRVVPLMDALLRTVERVRTDAVDHAWGEAFRLGRDQGRQQAERDLARELSAKDEIIASLTRGYEEQRRARADEEGSIASLALVLRGGRWTN